MYQIKPWSFSSIKTYETCPRKYMAEKVTKEVPYTDTEATIYGKDIHKACEDFIQDGTPIPEKYAFIRPVMTSIQQMSGDKFVEQQVGIAKHGDSLVACEFDSDDVWFRGIADLVIIDGDTAKIIDYKSSKNAKYADTRQLALMAAAIFLKHPEVKTIKGGLLFFVCNAFIKANYTVDRRFDIFAQLDGTLQQRDVSYATGVFNPKPNALCKKWCKVYSCPHNGGY